MSSSKPAEAPGIGDKSSAEAVATRDQKPIEAEVTGFGPFRSWANNKIRRMVEKAKIHHNDLDYFATELTHDGRLRLVHGENVVLVTFEEPYITELLDQIT